MTDQFQATSGSPVGVTVSGEAAMMLSEFWPKTMEEIRKLKHDNFKQQELPLARIKKIMKLDEDVKMISQEAPVLFAKAAEIFISELSLRAWIHTEDNKRRTLQRNDIAMAITKYDQFDFLIDIVPRDELKPSKRPAAQQPQIIQIQAPQIQQTVSQIQTAPQVIQTQAVTPQAPQVQIQQQAQQPQQTQVYQQVITASGEVQNVPSSQQPAIQTVQTATQSNQSQFGTQSVFQIQQLPGGQQVYIQNQGETDQADVSQDGT
ncbi:hypothetical protein KUTeg_016494 [Tegillarca granosa]|uniref:Nuclear transcription factor Y subunit gamma n=1 Tax=Tegillarca granosa TaxID=220873 RepID=A0ABQ9EL31_TEGGR|nr:hypothetical protein KUTeg_016494 [Tegillarca granosa]